MTRSQRTTMSQTLRFTWTSSTIGSSSAAAKVCAEPRNQGRPGAAAKVSLRDVAFDNRDLGIFIESAGTVGDVAATAVQGVMRSCKNLEPSPAQV